MIQRKHSDFFERLTLDVARLFAVLIGKNIDEVEEELNLAYNEWLSLDRKSFDEIKQDELLPTLLNEMKLEVDHIEILADIFTKEGELYFNGKRFLKSKQKLKNAIKLYDFVDREKQIFSFERQETLKKINGLIYEIESNHKNENT
jgi:hypothetical protein